MNKINLILLILLLNPSLISMLTRRSNLLKLNEYFVDTCCSLNENDKIYLSCGQNEKIHLNLIKIYYNSNEYCSSELYCCKYETKCSRRITKYSNLHCDEKNSCWIDKTCLKIYEPCSSIYGLYGQYITIDYSCLPSKNIYQILNQTNSFNSEEEPVPFIVKLSTFDQTTIKTIKQFHLKSSPIFFIFIIFLFLLFLFLIYWLANFIGNKICRENSEKKSVKTKIIPTKILVEHLSNNKIKVQSSNPSLPITRIYPLNNKYSYQRSIYHQPYSTTTFYPYFNY